MGLILNIDTSTEQAGICLAREEHVLGILRNDEQKDHASWLHAAMKSLMENAGFTLNQLDAIAVTAGPGSYTGLRVGMAAAKGLCYALEIPLVLENTLKVMALAGSQQPQLPREFLICPMIDARRMEVFTAIYSKDLQEIMPSTALVLEADGFGEWMKSQEMIFLGSGILKWKELTKNPNALFFELPFLASHLAQLAHEKFEKRQFSDVYSSEPVYLKEFHTHIKK